ncbi:MAG: radical SAM protein [Deltaproteobacteria bacterium]|nr:radical SAM protein [Deltaproteobacteria bacterium]
MDLRGKVKLAQAVLRYQVGWESTPIAVAWLVTGRCTASCTYCRWKRLRESPELDTAQALRMIDDMHDAGVLMISFTGGEPLLRDDIGELTRHVKARGLVCKLNTNGLLVERHLKELGPLDLLQVSLDGPPSLHDPLRGAGSAERVTRAVKCARDAGISLQLVACLSKATVGAIDEVLRYALELRVPLHFQPVAPADLSAEDREASVPSRVELGDAFAHLLHLQRRRDRLARAIGNPRSELQYHLEVCREGRRGCDAALVTATMLPDGELIFCGNAIDYESFSAVKLGFRNAFARLSVPDCEGCTCVGKLRLTKVFRLDPDVIWEVLGL